jgi:hypothetical protein
MNKLLLITLAGVLMFGCAAQEEVVKPFHPTDDISAQAQGGKGHTSDGSEVQLEAPAPVKTKTPAPVKPFHPTDDISAQAQGGKGQTSDGSEVQLP